MKSFAASLFVIASGFIIAEAFKALGWQWGLSVLFVAASNFGVGLFRANNP